MMIRYTKVKLLQFFLLAAGTLLIIFTYTGFKNKPSEEILSLEAKDEINKKIKDKNPSGDTFFNVEYSGIDLAGNRYILRAKEANNDITNSELINLKYVKATFYFKNNKILYVSSNFGLYNNKTLDIVFRDNVNSMYEGSKLFAEEAEYNNSENFIIISQNVKITDIKGTMLAEKLIFDIEKNTLEISSLEDDKVYTNLKRK
ncbi:LPS export ABC transporter periplasmic protein LptC [Pelagibacterales bacterium SAG-MED28]|nr:LPS export ABC transporter periplasmic protein LptC [Pelagibacterales bacterium SAG-MED28]|tara:strand:- start:5369 stop:5974 length:606 start_codon:yes stop_codon:yes gene_type:complete